MKFSGLTDWRGWGHGPKVDAPKRSISAELSDDHEQLTIRCTDEAGTIWTGIMVRTDGYYITSTFSVKGENEKDNWKGEAKVSAYLRKLSDGKWRLLGDWFEREAGKNGAGDDCLWWAILEEVATM